MDSTEVYHSPNFTQHRTCTDGNVTPPMMSQNFMGESIEEANLQMQKQLLIEQLKQELAQSQQSAHVSSIQNNIRKKSRTRDP